MTRRVAVIGAGPLGIEAALRAAERGWDVTVYEAAHVGAHLLQWGHVRFFTTLRDNVSTVALAHLPGVPLDACLTGAEFVARVLRPLAAGPLAGRIVEGARVTGVSRRRLAKPDLPGHPLRQERPFQLTLDEGGAVRTVEADLVFDATGVYGRPAGAGESGLSPAGAPGACARMTRHLPDILGTDRSRHAGWTTLVVGSGQSAATAIVWLAELAAVDPQTRVHWVVRTDRARPTPETAHDPLPDRARLVAAANDLAERPLPGWSVHRRSALLGVAETSAGRFACTVGRGETRTTLEVDNVLALTGYRADNAHLEELQVRLSPVTGGADGLAAALMGITDCLTPVTVTPDQLRSGEEGFYFIGHRSYGALNTFLLRAGLAQLDAIFSLARWSGAGRPAA